MVLYRLFDLMVHREDVIPSRDLRGLQLLEIPKSKSTEGIKLAPWFSCEGRRQAGVRDDKTTRHDKVKEPV